MSNKENDLLREQVAINQNALAQVEQMLGTQDKPLHMTLAAIAQRDATIAVLREAVPCAHCEGGAPFAYGKEKLHDIGNDEALLVPCRKWFPSQPYALATPDAGNECDAATYEEVTR